MNWTTAALIAALLWATANVLDKLVASRLLPKPSHLLFISTGVGFLGGIIFVLTTGFSQVEPSGVLLALLSGAFYATGLYWYFRAMRTGAAETNALFMQFTPAVTLLLATVFLGESFRLPQYLGLGLLVLAGLLVSAKPSFKGWQFVSASTVAISVACIAWAGSSVLAKALLEFIDLPTFFFWARTGALGTGLGLWLFLPDESGGVQEKRFLGLWSVWILLLVSEVLNTVGLLFSNFAFTQGPVTLCNGVLSTQPLYVLVLLTLIRHGLGLNLFEPESCPARVILAAIAMTTTGIILVSTG